MGAEAIEGTATGNPQLLGASQPPAGELAGVRVGKSRHAASAAGEAAGSSATVTRRTPHPIGYAAKRVVDYVGTAAGLLIIAPFLLVAVIAIKLDSPGPALFTQTRVGKNGRPFLLYKFRSMSAGCDPKAHEEHVTKLILGEAGDEARGADGSFKLQADARVTRVGAFLRRTSIDEIPQLFNVLNGEMSLVGPRPPLEYEVAVYSPRHARRLEVLPGLTGLWQVSGRTRLSFEEMIDLDLQYIDEWSPRMELKIWLKTLPAVKSTEGAG